MTTRLLAASDLIGVRMLDHVIVAGETGEMFSFKQEGLLDQLRPKDKVWER